MESVVCINNSCEENHLTVGKTYTIIDKQYDGKYYRIYEDGGQACWVASSRFKPKPAIAGNVLVKPKVYIIGSLRNPKIPVLASTLRQNGFDVFDDWFAAGPKADDHWKEYEQARGRTYKEAMHGYAARHVFEFDKKHIDEADIGVMLLPAGKSGHAELGYMKGKGKKCIVYLESDNDRWDIMYNFFDHLVYTDEELIEALNA